ncbi:hypothetical protein AU468_07915, partial [Alkalispirochaeta sphaeroplastigenens]
MTPLRGRSDGVRPAGRGFRSLRLRMVVLFGGTAVFLLITLGAVLVWRVSTVQRGTVMEMAGQIVEARSAEVQRWLEGHIQEIRGWSSLNIIRTGDIEEIGQYLEGRQGTLHPEHENVFFADTRGQAVSSDGFRGNLLSRRYVQEILDGAEYAISNGLESASTGQAIMAIAYAVKDDQGNIVGVAGAAVSLDVLSELTRNMSFGESGYGAVIGGDGVVIGHPDRSVVMSLNITDAPDWPGMEAIGRGVTRGERGAEYFTNLRGQRNLGIFSPVIGSPRWSVVYILPMADLNAPVQELTGIITTIFLLALIVLALTAWVVAGRIAKPIRAVALSLDDVAHGEADLRVALEVSGRDEVGQISGNFNTFLGVLREMIGGIRGATDQLSLVGGDLSVNMEETSAAITQIAANVASLTDQVLNQSAGVSEVTATIEEISRNMESLDEQVQNQSSVVSQSSAAIEQMMASIRSVAERLDRNAGSFHELVEAADQGRVKLEGMIGINRRIAEQSSRLQEASSVIHAIAQQTNLLSMNAAIEAAHAGEYGRGFAVVAAEIRKLAEEAGAQSRAIGQELSAVSSSIQEAVTSAEDVSGAFAAVHSRIREVDENEGQIRNAMEEQSAGSVQILKALEQISAVTDSVHEGSGE